MSARPELKALIAQQKTLEAQYTPDHPDVVEVRRKDRRSSRGDRTHFGLSRRRPRTRPLSIGLTRRSFSNLEAQLRAAQQAMVDGKQDQARIEEQVRNYESRIESSPAVEEQYKQITRDHETALEFYNSLLKKMNESSMATALEQRQQGEQFHMVDAPNLPDDPIFPNREALRGRRARWRFVRWLAACRSCLAVIAIRSLRNERDTYGPLPSFRRWR